MKKNLFLTFCFSFIPGAGQMYQGYMKRGVSIMLLAGLLFGLSTMISIPILVIPFLVILAYSFFDTYNIRNKIGTNEKLLDKYIWEETSVEEVLNKLKINKKSPIIGGVLIFIGVYILLNTVLYRIAYQYEINVLLNFISLISRYLVPVFISIFTIGLGIKFVSKK